MDFRYVESQKNKKKLYCGGFFYTKEKSTENTVYWKCDQWVKKCRARATINNLGIFTLKREHDHDGDPLKQLEVVEAVSKIKQKAATGKDAPRAIISEVMSSMSTAAITHFPSVSSLSRNVRHCRENQNPEPSVPLTLSVLTISDKYKNTAKGDQFLLYDSQDEDRVIIFGTPKNLELLRCCPTWLLDGTFQTVPSLFYQLYTIHGEIEDAHFPLVFGLLPNKLKVYT